MKLSRPYPHARCTVPGVVWGVVDVRGLGMAASGFEGHVKLGEVRAPLVGPDGRIPFDRSNSIRLAIEDVDMCPDVVHHFLSLKTHRQMERMIAAPSFEDGGRERRSYQ
jgi:hypothetical protein